MKVYIGEQQFTIKDEIWGAILDVVHSVSYEEIYQFTKSIDELVSEHGT